MESVPTLLYQYRAPTDLSLRPAESSKPILSPSYELSPKLIAMVKDQSFSGKVNENPYSHLCEFEQICACLHIEGMSYETLWWKFFLSLWLEKLNIGIIATLRGVKESEEP
jgi:hypothetical protein